MKVVTRTPVPIVSPQEKAKEFILDIPRSANLLDIRAVVVGSGIQTPMGESIQIAALAYFLVDPSEVCVPRRFLVVSREVVVPDQAQYKASIVFGEMDVHYFELGESVIVEGK